MAEGAVKEGFEDLKESVLDLELGASNGAVVGEVVECVVVAARRLAREAIDLALESAGSGKKPSKEIAAAEEEMTEGEEAVSAGDPGKAIDHFRKAWEDAQKALNERPAMHGVESVAEAERAMGAGYFMAQNAPNPFTGGTQIRLELPVPSHIRLEVFDVSGRLVRTLADQERSRGVFTISWNRRDDRGREASMGVFLCRLTARALDGSMQYTKTRRMILLRSGVSN